MERSKASRTFLGLGCLRDNQNTNLSTEWTGLYCSVSGEERPCLPSGVLIVWQWRSITMPWRQVRRPWIHRATVLSGNAFEVSRVPLRMCTMAWKVVSGAGATNSCKKYWHISKKDTCPVCGKNKESSFHALVTCDHAHALWEQMRRMWKLPGHDMLVHTGKD